MMDGFFKTTDPEVEELSGVELEKNFWWSRRFEYPFALSFIKQKDTILDAACGAIHPFKHAASDLCRKVYACDIEGLYASLQAVGFKLGDRSYDTTDAIESTYWGRRLQCYHIAAEK